MNFFKANFDSILLTLYLVAIAAPISNAYISISMALCILYILYDLYKTKSYDGFKINRIFIYSLLFFLGTLFLGSLILGDMKSLLDAKNLAEWSLGGLLISFYISRKSNCKDIIGLGLTIALLLMSLLSFQEFIKTHRRVQIFFGYCNTYALVLDVVVPLVFMYAYECFRTAKSKFYLSFVVLSGGCGFVSIVLTASRSAIIGLLGGFILTCLAYCVINRRGFKQFAIVLCLVLVAGFGMYQKNIGRMGADRLQPDVNRFYMWSSAYNMWKDHKLTGVGMHNWTSNYRDKYRKPGATVYGMAHSIYFIFLSTAGLLGFIGLFVFIFGNILSLAGALKINSVSWLVLAALWVSFTMHIMGLVDAGFTMKSACRIFFAVLGLGYGSMLNIKDKEEVKNEK